MKWKTIQIPTTANNLLENLDTSALELNVLDLTGLGMVGLGHSHHIIRITPTELRDEILLTGGDCDNQSNFHVRPRFNNCVYIYKYIFNHDYTYVFQTTFKHLYINSYVYIYFHINKHPTCYL